MPTNPTWEDVAEEKAPTWDDVDEGDKPSWNDISDESPEPSPFLEDNPLGIQPFSPKPFNALEPKPFNPLDPTDPLNAPGAPEPTTKELLMGPFTAAGDFARAGVADVAAGMSALKRPRGAETMGSNLEEAASRSGNILASLKGDPLPIDTTLADISREAPVAATVGKISQGVAASAPLIAFMPQGALGKLVAAGFTADMLHSAGPQATALGEEMGKPPEDRDYDKITTSLSGLIQTAGFAPLTGAHAGGRAIGERVAPRAEAIRELAKALKSEPITQTGYQVAPPGQRQLGIRIPEGEFAQPGILPLADAALREAQGGIVVPGRQSAIDALRNEINPPKIDLIEPTRMAERVQGGGEAPYGKVSYQRKAEAPTAERTQNVATQEAPKAAQVAEAQPDLGLSTKTVEAVDRGAAPAVKEVAKDQGEVLLDKPAIEWGKEGAAKKASDYSQTEWDTLVENLIDNADTFASGGASRHGGARPYELNDAIYSFADFARSYKGTISEAFADFRKFTDVEPKYIRQIREVLKSEGHIQPKGAKNVTKSKAPKSAQAVEVGESGGIKAEEVSATEKKIDTGDTADMGRIGHDTGIEYGLSLPESHIPRIEAKYNAAQKDMQAATTAYMEAMRAKNDPAMAKAEIATEQAFNQNNFYGGALVALTKGERGARGNYEVYMQRKAAKEKAAAPKPSEQPAPAPEVESVTALDPASGNPISSVSKILEKADARLAQIQAGLRGGRNSFTGITGLEPLIAEGAIVAARGALKATGSIAKAVAAAIDWIRTNHPRLKFDSDKFRAEMMAELTKASDIVPRIEGGPEAMRKSAERATTSEQIPEVVQDRIATAPESFYQKQKVTPRKEPDGRSVEEVVGAMADAELAAVPKESNFHVASQLELSRRLFDQGKLEEGYQVFRNVSKLGTDFGQNINQFKMLKGTTPADIVHIVNQGLKEGGKDPLTKKQMEGLAQVADESISANKALKQAKVDWQKEPTDANAKKAQRALDAADAADLKTQREMNRFKVRNWPQMLKTFAQGNPLTPISHVSNFVGNSVGAFMEGGSRGVASMMDTIRAGLTGNERLINSTPKAIAASTKGFSQGLEKVPGILSKGTGDVVKGESRAGLQPLRALAKAFAKNPDVPTTGGKVPINERIRLATEGTFGIAPETMLRLLSAADRPAYEAARARLISEQARLKKIPKDQLRMAQKFPELFFNKEILKQIKDESADAIFQRPSKAVANLQSLIREKGGDWGDLAFTLMVSPYKLTPWNLVVRTLQYNPLVAAVKTAMEAKRGNVRAAEISAGRMVIGSLLYSAGYFLYQNGLIGPSLEGRDESQKSRMLSGEVLPPNHVNISGLSRMAQGGSPEFKPGDKTIDLTRGGGAAGAVLASVANIGRKMERQPEATGADMAASLVKDGVLEQANFTINQSFLKGVTGILDAIQNGNIDPYITGVENMLLNVATPNTLTALSRATRQYAPDMKSETAGQQFANVIKNRFGILGADDYLTAKRGLFGEPMPQTPEGRNAILYHLFDISKGKQVTDDPVKLEMYRLWRKTANSAVIPSIPEREITVNNQTYRIPTELYSKFAEYVGTRRKEILDNLVLNPDFNKETDEAKIDWMEKAYRFGMDYGKAKLWSEHGKELQPIQPRSGFKK